MKRAWSIGLLTIALFIHSPSEAEFYRYTDSHGNVIFTDDLSKIPVEKRDQAKAYEEPEQRTVPSGGVGQPSKTVENAPDASEAIRKVGERLQSLRDTLDQEYNALVEENNNLREEQKQAVTPDQIKAVNKKVVSFNARFKAYQEKAEAFKSELDAYNNRVEAAETK